MKIILDLKSLLKTLKLNESVISMTLGALVIVVVGVLVVNYFRGQEGGRLPALSEINESQTTEDSTHTVAEGESLWGIAEQYYGDGYSWTRIAEANDLDNANTIEVGQVLEIPEVQEGATVTPSPIAQAEDTGDDEGQLQDSETQQDQDGQISSESYEVQSGDNLWNISVRAYGDGYRWVEVARANELVNPDLIHPGNVLVLPR